MIYQVQILIQQVHILIYQVPLCCLSCHGDLFSLCTVLLPRRCASGPRAPFVYGFTSTAVALSFGSTGPRLVCVCVFGWVGACVTSSHISHSRYMSKGFYSKDFQQCCSCHFVAHTHTHTLRSRHLSICSLCRAHSPSSHRCRPSQEATVSHIPRSRSACSSCRCISCRPRTWCVSCGPLSSERADTSSCCCSSCARRTPA